MHIELSKDKDITALVKSPKHFVNASLIRFGIPNLFWNQKNAKGNQNVHAWRCNEFTAYLSSCKERGFTLEGAKTHLKEGKKKP
jgi:hypothetical protein